MLSVRRVLQTENIHEKFRRKISLDAILREEKKERAHGGTSMGRYTITVHVDMMQMNNVAHLANISVCHCIIASHKTADRKTKANDDKYS